MLVGSPVVSAQRQLTLIDHPGEDVGTEDGDPPLAWNGDAAVRSLSLTWTVLQDARCAGAEALGG
jgi:hypothetical protein